MEDRKREPVPFLRPYTAFSFRLPCIFDLLLFSYWQPDNFSKAIGCYFNLKDHFLLSKLFSHREKPGFRFQSLAPASHQKITPIRSGPLFSSYRFLIGIRGPTLLSVFFRIRLVAQSFHLQPSFLHDIQIFPIIFYLLLFKTNQARYDRLYFVKAVRNYIIF